MPKSNPRKPVGTTLIVHQGKLYKPYSYRRPKLFEMYLTARGKIVRATTQEVSRIAEPKLVVRCLCGWENCSGCTDTYLTLDGGKQHE